MMQNKTIQSALNTNLKNPIIFHAASAGEFEQIKPLLRKRSVNQPILQTFFSPTIYNKEKKSKLFDACCYHPFDFPWSAYYFFKKIAPKKYIINRHDIWPHHIFFAKLFKIKIIYINANLKSNSSRLRPVFKGFHKWLFHQIDIIIVPSDEIKKRFIANFETTNILTFKDTRFEQIKYHILKNTRIPGIDNLLKKKNIVLGSIDRHDWSVILESIKNTKLDKFNLIIVPHEINQKFINSIITDIKELRLKVDRITNINHKNNTTKPENVKLNCIIYDKVGDLLDLYKYAPLAYVGCGFSTGVHNISEPALQGCYVSYGPNISLLDEAIKLKKHKLSKIIYNSADFTDFTNIENNGFLIKNREKITKLFKGKNDDFNKLINRIYEA
tara:strand:- start:1879 stop:3033 length:1155 start_codon:yes stop_codon:yes gene_type:complete